MPSSPKNACLFPVLSATLSRGSIDVPSTQIRAGCQVETAKSSSA